MKNGGRQNPRAIAADMMRRSAGDAGADFRFVRNVWKKISGECPATASHGNARTAKGKTDSVTNNH